MPASMIERHVGEVLAQGAERIGVGEAAAGADRRAPRHQHLATGRQQALGRDQILGRVGKDLEAVLGRALPAASTRPNRSGCSVSSLPITSSLIQSVPNSSRAICAVVIASLRRAAAGGVGQHAHAQRLDQIEEALAGVARAPSRAAATP